MSEDSGNIIVNNALLKSNLADLLGGKTPMPNDEDDYALSYNRNDNDASNIQTEAVRDFLE